MSQLPVPRGIRAVSVSQRFVRSIVAGLEAVQSAVAMGFINDSSFEIFDLYPFNETRPINCHANVNDGLESWEQHIWTDHLQGVRSLLIVGAGGGREVLGFRRKGVSVHGVEYGRILVDATNEVLLDSECPASVRWAVRYKIPDFPDPCQGAFFARKFYSHIHDRRRRIQVLRDVRRAIEPGSPLVLSYYTRERDSRSFRLQSGLANLIRRIRRAPGAAIEIGDHIDPESPLLHHHFTSAEVESELGEAGFDMISHDSTWFGWAIARSRPEEPAGDVSKTNVVSEYVSREAASPAPV